MRLKITRAQWLVCLRIILGVVFIVASAGKLSGLSLFISEVTGYGLLPFSLARVYGAVLPWVELFIGCSLVLGLFITPSLIISILATLSFIVASIFALVYGNSDSCGCFGQIIPLGHFASVIIDLSIILAVILLFRQRQKIEHITIDTLFAKCAGKYKIPTNVIRRVIQVTLLIIVVVFMCFSLVYNGPPSRVYSEISDSLEQGTPVFLYFYLEGCVMCDWQKPIIDDLQKQFRDNIRFIQVNYKAEARLAVELEVTSVPTMLLIGHNNSGGYKIVRRFGPLTDETTLQSSIQELLNSEIPRGVKSGFSLAMHHRQTLVRRTQFGGRPAGNVIFQSILYPFNSKTLEYNFLVVNVSKIVYNVPY